MASKGFTRSDELNRHMKRGVHLPPGPRLKTGNMPTAPSNAPGLAPSAAAVSAPSGPSGTGTSVPADDDSRFDEHEEQDDDYMEQDAPMNEDSEKEDSENEDSVSDNREAEDTSSHAGPTEDEKQDRGDSSESDDDVDEYELLENEVARLRGVLREREWRIRWLEEMVAETGLGTAGIARQYDPNMDSEVEALLAESAALRRQIERRQDTIDFLEDVYATRRRALLSRR